jgi:hypothetical protein
MALKVKFHPLFDADVHEAVRWYDQRSAGLGRVFFAAVEKRIVDATDNPARFARMPSGSRFVRLPRFPYVLLFDVLDDAIVFFGVMHTARDDAKWQARQTDF